MEKSRELLQLLEEVRSDLVNKSKLKEREVLKAPNGCLRISRRGRKIQYYQIGNNTGTHGKYLRKKNEPLIKALAQKTYDRKLLILLKRQLEQIEMFIGQELFTAMDNLYISQSKDRRNLITPIRYPDNDYQAIWEAHEYTGLPFRPENTSAFYTDKGERVRSKSEVLIANALYRNKIPYRYECPYKLPSGKIIYPDFTILNVRERKEIKWEHFGMLDDPLYRDNMMEKMERFTDEGLFLGDNLIITGETSKHPLKTRTIDTMIKRYCK